MEVTAVSAHLPCACSKGNEDCIILLNYCSSHMNNIVRIMLRRGILTDLARVSHYLDLSSPNMPASVNAALKPLETLSRIVNQPSTTSNNKVGKQKAQGSVSEEPAGDHTGLVYEIIILPCICFDSFISMLIVHCI